MKHLFLFALSSLLALSACNSQQPAAGSTVKGGLLDAQAFQKQLQATADAVLIDLRTPGEVSQGIIAGAKVLDYNAGELTAELPKMDKNKPYFIYCAGGGRSGEAAQLLKQQGFKEVYDLQGGMMNWKRNGLPVAQNTNTDKPAPAKTEGMSMQDYQALIGSDRLILIDYYAPWCGPCRKMEPMLEELSKVYEGKVKIVRLNTDANEDLSIALNIEAIPYFHLYKEGKVVWSFTGAIERAPLEQVLKQHL